MNYQKSKSKYLTFYLTYLNEVFNHLIPLNFDDFLTETYLNEKCKIIEAEFRKEKFEIKIDP